MCGRDPTVIADAILRKDNFTERMAANVAGSDQNAARCGQAAEAR